MLGALVAQVADPGFPSGFFSLKLSAFPALQKDQGSVRVGINRVSNNSPTGGSYPIIINRESAEKFYALDSECTHASCVVGVYASASKSSTCPCHGSRYGIDGRRLAGPAAGPLKTYPIQFDGVDTLTVEIPGLGFSSTASEVQAGGRARFLLEFPSYLGAEHEVLFRASLSDPWSTAKFSTTAEGIADKTFITGNDRVLKLYLDRSGESGFYAVTMKVKSV